MQDLFKDLQVSGGWIFEDAERRNRASSHGINVAQGISSRDSSVGVGIVGHGCQNIYGLHERGIGAQAVHGCVVAGFKADKHIWIGRARQPTKYGVQKTWTQLCRSTGSLGEF